MKVSKKVESNAVKSGQRFELADAWREAGLDELEVAQTMAGLIKTSYGKGRQQKDPSRRWEGIHSCPRSPKATVRAGASDVPVTLSLDDDVPRPDRQLFDELFAIQNSPKCQTPQLPPRDLAMRILIVPYAMALMCRRKTTARPKPEPNIATTLARKNGL
jgi:hypothetical protein